MRIFNDEIIFDFIFFIFEKFQNKQIFLRYNILIKNFFFCTKKMFFICIFLKRSNVKQILFFIAENQKIKYSSYLSTESKAYRLDSFLRISFFQRLFFSNIDSFDLLQLIDYIF